MTDRLDEQIAFEGMTPAAHPEDFNWIRLPADDLNVRVIAHRGGAHECQLPGWWRRRRLGLGIGAMVECRVCLTRWEWRDNAVWHKIIDLDNLPQPYPGPAPGAR